MNATDQSKAKALLALVESIGDLVKSAGSQGIPSGELYAMLMPHGMTLDNHNFIVGVLVDAGKITNRGHLLVWKEK